MNKKSLEIILALGSVVLLIIFVTASNMVLKSYAGFGYTASLLFFIIIMGLAGLKLAQIPDR